MFSKYVVQHKKSLYLCIKFFMVLDLRLTIKIGCRDDNHFFCLNFSVLHVLDFPRISSGKQLIRLPSLGNIDLLIQNHSANRYRCPELRSPRFLE